MIKVKSLKHIKNYGPSLWLGKTEKDETFVVTFFLNVLYYTISEDNDTAKWIPHHKIENNKLSEHFVSPHQMKLMLSDVFDFSELDAYSETFKKENWEEKQVNVKYGFAG